MICPICKKETKEKRGGKLYCSNCEIYLGDEDGFKISPGFETEHKEEKASPSFESVPISTYRRSLIIFPRKILLLIILALVVIGVLYLTQYLKFSLWLPVFDKTLDLNLNPLYVEISTTNWKNYNLQNLNFKYPSDWEIKPATWDSFQFASLTKKGEGFSLIIGTAWKEGTCKEYLGESGDGADFKKESTLFKLKDLKGAILFFSITTPQFDQVKQLNICIEKDGHEYGVMLNEKGAGRNFSNLKNTVILLNTLNFQ